MGSASDIVNGIRLMAQRKMVPSGGLFEKILNSNNDFSELRKFQPKPLKPRFDIGLKTPNPEGFRITLKTLRDISIFMNPVRGGGPPPDRVCQRLRTRPLNAVVKFPKINWCRSENTTHVPWVNVRVGGL